MHSQLFVFDLLDRTNEISWGFTMSRGGIEQVSLIGRERCSNNCPEILSMHWFRFQNFDRKSGV